jgi:hypothetical protein
MTVSTCVLSIRAFPQCRMDEMEDATYRQALADQCDIEIILLNETTRLPYENIQSMYAARCAENILTYGNTSCAQSLAARMLFKCQNGGEMIKDELRCACPAGFVGRDCSVRILGQKDVSVDLVFEGASDGLDHFRCRHVDCSPSSSQSSAQGRARARVSPRLPLLGRWDLRRTTIRSFVLRKFDIRKFSLFREKKVFLQIELGVWTQENMAKGREDLFQWIFL